MEATWSLAYYSPTHLKSQGKALATGAKRRVMFLPPCHALTQCWGLSLRMVAVRLSNIYLLSLKKLVFVLE